MNVPSLPEVERLLNTQTIADTYYSRGSGHATSDLDKVEETHRQWVSDMIDLSDFSYCYYVNGVTDAIHHWEMTDKRPWQKLCYGEYEYRDMIGLKGSVTCDVPGQFMDKQTHRAALSGRVDPDKPLYISTPSAADGNIFNAPVDDWNNVPPVILDCTYVSSTATKQILVPSTTEQVFFSFSKGFGLIGNRLGLVYTKEPHPTLHRLKQFENWNYAGVKTMQLIMDTFAVDDMYNKYKHIQQQICEDYNFTPSDVFYLATTRDRYYTRRRRMKWNDSARICLTPLFKDYL